jgi:amino acid adenylation domain-containing protein
MPLTDPAALNDRLSALSPEQRALFETLREKQRKAAARPAQPPPLRRVTGPTAEGDWPLSFDQERFWFVEQLFPAGAGLVITAATRMRGPISVPAVRSALDAIVRRHAAWRTSFPRVDGRPVQRVSAPRPQPLVVIDLASLPEARREAEALRLVGEEAAAPFDLEAGFLVRSVLVRLGPADHVFILAIHHLVTDWISFQIAFAELAALLASNGSSALPEPPVQYPDFAVWQREWLRGEVLDGLVSWWRERLSDFPLTLEMPADRPRPAVMRLRGGRLPLRVSGGLAAALRDLARREGVTLFMTVLAATAGLLHRASGQERLILGANNANRNRPELEPVLGCFLTQVPFPIDLAGDPTFRELLARARQSALGAFAHQDLPFGKLVEAVQPARDTSRAPIVQALVQVLDAHDSGADLAGVTFEAVDAWDGIARYDLLLTLFDHHNDHDGGLLGSLEYDADLFDATTAARLAELLFLQMERAAAEPDIRLSSLPALSEAARHQVLVEWNDSARPLPDWTVPERLAARAAVNPGAVAVLAGGESLTYGELERRSDALACRLRAAGVEPESRVALLLDRTVDMPVAILAVWKAGGAYVPLDPDWPAARLALVMEDAEPAVLVHRGATAACGPLRALDLDDPADPMDIPPQPLPPPDPRRLAYLIYTSGTTGTPKAVAVEHRSLASTLASVLDRFGFGPDDRMPHLSRFTFDISLVELFAVLLAGGVCEILSLEEILDPDALLGALEGSTRVHAGPSLLPRVVGAGRLDGLRTILTGGEAVPPALREAVLAAFPRADLAVLYGPTETAILATAFPVPRENRPGRSLIGRPLDNVEVLVMDSRGGLVPMGMPGELWIGGPGVARGYFRRPEMTAERFVAGFYRSGDLVRQVPSEGGALEFLGRTDHQVKLRGVRIEPGEVEAALLRHPGVREAVVAVREDALGPRLVAWVVPADADGAGLGPGLRRFLAAELPDPMVPSAFVVLQALPRTPNGKLDRAALVSPASPDRSLEPSDTYMAPGTPLEETLARVVSEVLGEVLDGIRVGMRDNFFELGGHSLLATQLVSRLAREHGLPVSLRMIFDAATLADLADRIVQKELESADAELLDEALIELMRDVP